MEQNFILSCFGVYPLYSGSDIHWQEIQLDGKNTLSKTPLTYLTLNTCVWSWIGYHSNEFWGNKNSNKATPSTIRHKQRDLFPYTVPNLWLTSKIWVCDISLEFIMEWKLLSKYLEDSFEIYTQKKYIHTDQCSKSPLQILKSEARELPLNKLKKNCQVCTGQVTHWPLDIYIFWWQCIQTQFTT